jgi:hypothetical protein
MAGEWIITQFPNAISERLHIWLMTDWRIGIWFAARWFCGVFSFLSMHVI